MQCNQERVIAEIDGKTHELSGVRVQLTESQERDHESERFACLREPPLYSLALESPRRFPDSTLAARRVSVVMIDRSSWIFPAQRFVSFEPRDESWARFFGVGRSESRCMTFSNPELDFDLRGRLIVSGVPTFAADSNSRPADRGSLDGVPIAC